MVYNMAGKNAQEKLPVEEFILRAISALRKEGHTGIHTVYSKFNEAFREYYGEGADPVQAVKDASAKGIICSRPAKGGATIYLPEDGPQHAALKAMGLA